MCCFYTDLIIALLRKVRKVGEMLFKIQYHWAH